MPLWIWKLYWILWFGFDWLQQLLQHFSIVAGRGRLEVITFDLFTSSCKLEWPILKCWSVSELDHGRGQTSSSSSSLLKMGRRIFLTCMLPYPECHGASAGFLCRCCKKWFVGTINLIICMNSRSACRLLLKLGLQLCAKVRVSVNVKSSAGETWNNLWNTGSHSFPLEIIQIIILIFSFHIFKRD